MPSREYCSLVVMRRRGADPGREEPAELAALADGSLPPERRAALEAQIATSPELARRLDEQHRALTLVGDVTAHVAAPESLRTRVEAERRARQKPAVSRRIAFGGAAVAAAAVVCVAVAAVVLTSGSSAERLHTALGATSLSPGATGQATLTKTASGWRIALHATGLPRLENGRFYEGWLKNAAGVLVPIGTFNDGRNVTLWAGVSPKQFRTLTVTREKADGNQASSGEKVLVGTVGG